jgi:hypothetical protein
MTGLVARANGNSGIIVTVPNVTVGGGSVASRNVISGNTGSGINAFVQTVNTPQVALTIPSNLVVQGNYIGVKADGSGALANSSNGVFSLGPQHVDRRIDWHHARRRVHRSMQRHRGQREYWRQPGKFVRRDSAGPPCLRERIDRRRQLHWHQSGGHGGDTQFECRHSGECGKRPRWRYHAGPAQRRVWQYANRHLFRHDGVYGLDHRCRKRQRRHRHRQLRRR